MYTNIKINISKYLLINIFFVSIITYTGLQKHDNKERMDASFVQHTSQSAEVFYKKQCGFCHTNEELIAPDMNKIKATYLEKYKDKKTFIDAILKFVKNPDKKIAIYKVGINNFMDMPKMPFKDEQIKAVAEYIFDNSNL